MKRILLTHAYSAENLGDGLLVYEAIRLIRKSVGDCHITVLAAYPDSFENIIGVSYIKSKPSLKGYRLDYIKTLLGAGKYDLIVGVGGGYLRAGGLRESIGTILVHFPQILAAIILGKRIIYFPQSIGPFRCGWKYFYRIFLRWINRIYLRDDRSVQELKLGNCERVPDMAILKIIEKNRLVEFSLDYSLSSQLPVFSVRKVKGKLPSLAFQLASYFEKYDSYIQSTVSGNDDSAVSSLLAPTEVLSRSKLMGGGEIRVVVAIRLHAALMAIESGHYVIHLSYERKGFSAFADLGLADYVFNVNDFSIEDVRNLINNLISSEDARRRYRQRMIDGVSRYKNVGNEISEFISQESVK